MNKALVATTQPLSHIPSLFQGLPKTARNIKHLMGRSNRRVNFEVINTPESNAFTEEFNRFDGLLVSLIRDLEEHQDQIFEEQTRSRMDSREPIKDLALDPKNVKLAMAIAYKNTYNEDITPLLRDNNYVLPNGSTVLEYTTKIASLMSEERNIYDPGVSIREFAHAEAVKSIENRYLTSRFALSLQFQPPKNPPKLDAQDRLEWIVTVFTRAQIAKIIGENPGASFDQFLRDSFVNPPLDPNLNQGPDDETYLLDSLHGEMFPNLLEFLGSAKPEFPNTTPNDDDSPTSNKTETGPNQSKNPTSFSKALQQWESLAPTIPQKLKSALEFLIVERIEKQVNTFISENSADISTINANTEATLNSTSLLSSRNQDFDSDAPPLVDRFDSLLHDFIHSLYEKIAFSFSPDGKMVKLYDQPFPVYLGPDGFFYDKNGKSIGQDENGVWLESATFTKKAPKWTELEKIITSNRAAIGVRSAAAKSEYSRKLYTALADFADPDATASFQLASLNAGLNPDSTLQLTRAAPSYGSLSATPALVADRMKLPFLVYSDHDATLDAVRSDFIADKFSDAERHITGQLSSVALDPATASTSNYSPILKTDDFFFPEDIFPLMPTEGLSDPDPTKDILRLRSKTWAKGHFDPRYLEKRKQAFRSLVADKARSAGMFPEFQDLIDSYGQGTEINQVTHFAASSLYDNKRDINNVISRAVSHDSSPLTMKSLRLLSQIREYMKEREYQSSDLKNNTSELYEDVGPIPDEIEWKPRKGLLHFSDYNFVSRTPDNELFFLERHFDELTEVLNAYVSYVEDGGVDSFIPFPLLMKLVDDQVSLKDIVATEQKNAHINALPFAQKVPTTYDSVLAPAPFENAIGQKPFSKLASHITLTRPASNFLEDFAQYRSVVPEQSLAHHIQDILQSATSQIVDKYLEKYQRMNRNPEAPQKVKKSEIAGTEHVDPELQDAIAYDDADYRKGLEDWFDPDSMLPDEQTPHSDALHRHPNHDNDWTVGDQDGGIENVETAGSWDPSIELPMMQEELEEALSAAIQNEINSLTWNPSFDFTDIKGSGNLAQKIHNQFPMLHLSLSSIEDYEILCHAHKLRNYSLDNYTIQLWQGQYDKIADSFGTIRNPEDLPPRSDVGDDPHIRSDMARDAERMARLHGMSAGQYFLQNEIDSQNADEMIRDMEAEVAEAERRAKNGEASSTDDLSSSSGEYDDSSDLSSSTELDYHDSTDLSAEDAIIKTDTDPEHIEGYHDSNEIEDSDVTEGYDTTEYDDTDATEYDDTDATDFDSDFFEAEPRPGFPSKKHKHLAKPKSKEIAVSTEEIEKDRLSNKTEIENLTSNFYAIEELGNYFAELNKHDTSSASDANQVHKPISKKNSKLNEILEPGQVKEYLLKRKAHGPLVDAILYFKSIDPELARTFFKYYSNLTTDNFPEKSELDPLPKTKDPRFLDAIQPHNVAESVHWTKLGLEVADSNPKFFPDLYKYIETNSPPERRNPLLKSLNRIKYLSKLMTHQGYIAKYSTDASISSIMGSLLAEFIKLNGGPRYCDPQLREAASAQWGLFLAHDSLPKEMQPNSNPATYTSMDYELERSLTRHDPSLHYLAKMGLVNSDPEAIAAGKGKKHPLDSRNIVPWTPQEKLERQQKHPLSMKTNHTKVERKYQEEVHEKQVDNLKSMILQVSEAFPLDNKSNVDSWTSDQVAIDWNNPEAEEAKYGSLTSYGKFSPDYERYPYNFHPYISLPHKNLLSLHSRGSFLDLTNMVENEETHHYFDKLGNAVPLIQIQTTLVDDMDRSTVTNNMHDNNDNYPLGFPTYTQDITGQIRIPERLLDPNLRITMPEKKTMKEKMDQGLFADDNADEMAENFSEFDAFFSDTTSSGDSAGGNGFNFTSDEDSPLSSKIKTLTEKEAEKEGEKPLFSFDSDSEFIFGGSSSSSDSSSTKKLASLFSSEDDATLETAAAKVKAGRRDQDSLFGFKYSDGSSADMSFEFEKEPVFEIPEDDGYQVPFEVKEPLSIHSPKFTMLYTKMRDSLLSANLPQVFAHLSMKVDPTSDPSELNSYLDFYNRSAISAYEELVKTAPETENLDIPGAVRNIDKKSESAMEALFKLLPKKLVKGPDGRMIDMADLSPEDQNLMGRNPEDLIEKSIESLVYQNDDFLQRYKKIDFGVITDPVDMEDVGVPNGMYLDEGEISADVLNRLLPEKPRRNPTDEIEDTNTWREEMDDLMHDPVEIGANRTGVHIDNQFVDDYVDTEYRYLPPNDMDLNFDMEQFESSKEDFVLDRHMSFKPRKLAENDSPSDLDEVAQSYNNFELTQNVHENAKQTVGYETWADADIDGAGGVPMHETLQGPWTGEELLANDSMMSDGEFTAMYPLKFTTENLVTASDYWTNETLLRRVDKKLSHLFASLKVAESNAARPATIFPIEHLHKTVLNRLSNKYLLVESDDDADDTIVPVEPTALVFERMKQPHLPSPIFGRIFKSLETQIKAEMQFYHALKRRITKFIAVVDLVKERRTMDKERETDQYHQFPTLFDHHRYFSANLNQFEFTNKDLPHLLSFDPSIGDNYGIPANMFAPLLVVSQSENENRFQFTPSSTAFGLGSWDPERDVTTPGHSDSIVTDSIASLKARLAENPELKNILQVAAGESSSKLNARIAELEETLRNPPPDENHLLTTRQKAEYKTLKDSKLLNNYLSLFFEKTRQGRDYFTPTHRTEPFDKPLPELLKSFVTKVSFADPEGSEEGSKDAESKGFNVISQFTQNFFQMDKLPLLQNQNQNSKTSGERLLDLFHTPEDGISPSNFDLTDSLSTLDESSESALVPPSSINNFYSNSINLEFGKFTADPDMWLYHDFIQRKQNTARIEFLKKSPYTIDKIRTFFAAAPLASAAMARADAVNLTDEDAVMATNTHSKRGAFEDPVKHNLKGKNADLPKGFSPDTDGNPALWVPTTPRDQLSAIGATRRDYADLVETAAFIDVNFPKSELYRINTLFGNKPHNEKISSSEFISDIHIRINRAWSGQNRLGEREENSKSNVDPASPFRPAAKSDDIQTDIWALGHISPDPLSRIETAYTGGFPEWPPWSSEPNVPHEKSLDLWDHAEPWSFKYMAEQQYLHDTVQLDPLYTYEHSLTQADSEKDYDFTDPADKDPIFPGFRDTVDQKKALVYKRDMEPEPELDTHYLINLYRQTIFDPALHDIPLVHSILNRFKEFFRNVLPRNIDDLLPHTQYTLGPDNTMVILNDGEADDVDSSADSPRTHATRKITKCSSCGGNLPFITIFSASNLPCPHCGHVTTSKRMEPQFAKGGHFLQKLPMSRTRPTSKHNTRLQEILRVIATEKLRRIKNGILFPQDKSTAEDLEKMFKEDTIQTMLDLGTKLAANSPDGMNPLYTLSHIEPPDTFDNDAEFAHSRMGPAFDGIDGDAQENEEMRLQLENMQADNLEDFLRDRATKSHFQSGHLYSNSPSDYSKTAPLSEFFKSSKFKDSIPYRDVPTRIIPVDPFELAPTTSYQSFKEHSDALHGTVFDSEAGNDSKSSPTDARLRALGSQTGRLDKDFFIEYGPYVANFEDVFSNVNHKANPRPPLLSTEKDYDTNWDQQTTKLTPEELAHDHIDYSKKLYAQIEKEDWSFDRQRLGEVINSSINYKDPEGNIVTSDGRQDYIDKRANVVTQVNQLETLLPFYEEKISKDLIKDPNSTGIQEPKILGL